jgi:hypothetical protein
MEVMLVILLAAFVIGLLALMLVAATKGSRGPRYSGAAPYKGKVMRFNGTSSEVKEESGKQRSTEV